MEQIVIVIHVIVAITLIGLVLVQHGKGADVGAAFGSGSSNTMFGSSGAMPFLMKITALLAAIFFATNLIMSYLVGHRASLSQTNTEMVSQPALSVKPQTDKRKQEKFVFPSVNSASPQGSGQNKQ